MSTLCAALNVGSQSLGDALQDLQRTVAANARAYAAAADSDIFVSVAALPVLSHATERIVAVVVPHALQELRLYTTACLRLDLFFRLRSCTQTSKRRSL